MPPNRIHLDNRANHNALMACLCEQAAAALTRRINLTRDPVERESLRRRVLEHQLQSEMHRDVARTSAPRLCGYARKRASGRHNG